MVDMRKDVIVGIVFVVACLGMMGTILAEAEEYSQDYKDGYKNAHGLIGSIRYMDGLLDGALLTISVFDKDYNNVFMNAFARGFVKVAVPEYNKQVDEYNEMVTDVNMLSTIILGDEAEDYLLGEKLYYL